MAQEKTGIDYVMVYLQPQMLSEAAGQQEPILFSAPVVYNKRLRQTIQLLADAVFHSRKDTVCSELLLQFADHFTSASDTNVRGNNHALLPRAREMILCSIAKEQTFRLADLCREMDMPKYTFIRMFQPGTGISPYQFYLNCKVEKAKQIIKAGMDIYLAVAECGFVDLSHLNRNFKTRYGVTAHDYLSGIR